MPDLWTEKLDAYLDGELPARDMPAFDEHVRQCPECAAEAAGRLQIRRAVQSAGRRFAPAPEFRRRIQGMVAPPPRRLAWRWATGFAAAVVVLAFLAFQFNSTRQERRIYSEIADLHVGALASANRVDVVSTDRHTVKPWFEGRIPFTFNLPELQGSDFVLAGGRVAYLEQTPGAQLIYGLRKHQLSVFIFPEKAASAGSGAVEEATFDVESWSQNGLRYFVIGDAGAEATRKLAELFKRTE
ncbi:MAG TPA: anti-sigma factor [Terriglobales bacterium]|jgi:anti-sigma factor RsiW